MVKIAVVMGSISDKPMSDKLRDLFPRLGLTNDMIEYKILSAHRLPDDLAKYCKTLESRGIKVVIAIAGLAAALPGCIASHTLLPVIGVPLSSSTSGLGGTDALYSIVQMPTGVPVACVGINKVENAGILAVRILGLYDEKVRDVLQKYMETMRSTARNNLDI